MKTRKHTYKVHLEPEPEGGFTVTVPALPGCVTWGENYEHALEMAQECIEGYLEALSKAGQAVPEKPAAKPIDAFVEVKVPVKV
ncbi:MAG: type II toxin-antitoxin system HicB family antitoxin [bacterium]